MKTNPKKKKKKSIQENRKKLLLIGLPIAAVLIAAAVTLAVMLKPKPAAPPILASTGSDFHVNPIEGLSPDFIMGADVSMLHEIELNGGKFYVNGVEEDLLKILKDHGVNWIRLRIWVDPTDVQGNGLGGGNNDLATTIEIAARAKKLGLKVLIDFHYSDWWADPSTQTKPRAWKDLTGEALQQALYDYTAKVIKSLVRSHAAPDMVQLGNEINGGMLWPDGKVWQDGTEQIGGFDGLAALLNEGAQAVRDNDPHKNDPGKKIRIMIHLANGGDNDLYHTVFDALTERGVDFDIIGLSYYSFWHGPLADLISNMNEISAYYNKPVIIAEAAYPFTVDAGDDHDNLFGDGQQEQGGYEATMQGQATAMHDVIAAVAQVPDGRGLGIFYWEPEWIPVEGAGWKTGEGNAWENQAMFSFSGSALPSLNVFHLVRPENGGQVIQPISLEILPTEINLPLDGILEPPATVMSLLSDDSYKNVPVTWSDADPDMGKHPGTHTIHGIVTGTDVQVTATVNVSYVRNYVTNPGFETGDLSGWTVTGSTNAVNVSNERQNVYQPVYAMHYWRGEPFAFTLSQTITNLAPGSYSFSLWIQGGGGENLLQLFVKDCGGPEQTVAITNTGWQQWTNPTITEIPVTNGECTIGLKLDSPAGSWAFMDEAVFFLDK